jgi:hypothetical protein
MKVAISLTVHEQIPVILDQCRNILAAFDDPVVIIHLNELSIGIRDSLSFEINKRSEFSDAVYINEASVKTSKDSFNLHRAHYLNYMFLNEREIEYDYFLLEASNSLFVRRGVEGYIGAFDAGVGFGRITGYWAQKINSHKTVKHFLSNYLPNELHEGVLRKGCHEGSFYSRKIVHRVFDLINELHNMCEDNCDYPTYPTEEVWFQCAIGIISTSRPLKISGTLCHMPWDRDLNWNVPEIKKFISDTNFSKKFSIKRIDRDAENCERRYIADFMEACEK